MLNFRKLKQDYSSSVLKEGKTAYSKGSILSAKIVKLNPQNVRLSFRVMGNFDHAYQCEIEIDRNASTAIDSDCDCSYKYDCQHLASVLFYLEEHFDALLIAYSKESLHENEEIGDEHEKEKLRQTIQEAESKEVVRHGKKQQKELLQEYVSSSAVLGQSPFFHFEEDPPCDTAELAIIFNNPLQQHSNTQYSAEIQIALRLPYRSKPLNIPNVKDFLDAIRYCEPIYIGNKHYFFTLESFNSESRSLLKMILDNAHFVDSVEERNLRTAQLDTEAFGSMLAHAYEIALAQPPSRKEDQETTFQTLPCLYHLTLEEPLRFSMIHSRLNFDLEFLSATAPKILLTPSIILNSTQKIELEEARFFACAKPGMIHNSTYYRFPQSIRRKHLRNIHAIREITIPEPLFGTFVENSLPELSHYADVSNRESIDRFVTLPFVGTLSAECDINYLNGELEASLTFIYDKIKVPAAFSELTIGHITPFVTPQGILARNLTEEQSILKDLFQDFIVDPKGVTYVAKSDKKIVEFMTEVIPRNQDKIQFNCPQNLLDQFIYDDTSFELSLRETERIDLYEVDLKVDGHLCGVSLDLLWECLSSRRAFIELSRSKPTKKRGVQDGSHGKLHKILALNLDTLGEILQLFDEIGITELTNHTERRPLWSLSSIHVDQFERLPIKFSISDKLLRIQQQMLGNHSMVPSPIPGHINAQLREYQVDGVSWLERLRSMHLSGILADDMGLGKTLQAIIAITQHQAHFPESKTLIVCPTSLVYNWKEEFRKFNPQLEILPVDGTPTQRKKLLSAYQKYDVIITSYSLLQKDIEFYKTIHFAYVVLDEAQHIKNRSTRNAKSAKMIQAAHRLILTGTPIENSLDELWSLFDFLMPGLLSTYERFIDKYVRASGPAHSSNMDILRKKVNPFILRRMKKDVLAELPPVSEIIYRCHLSDLQRELYQSCAKSAREELSKLVKKEGFDRIQIHVLATLTRLKQICCHPAIFAKDTAESGDSIKYDMLLELLQTLIEGNHKTVVFSQYTRMLKIMVNDLQNLGIRFEYLDGSSKNRIDIVKRFNEDEQIKVFLVSLKAGGTGLNLTGADTVIHYDMWWNPAVESQATDRVHRLGQKRSVSACKLITLDTIEEKIMALQERKKGINQMIIRSDEDVIEKLTWEEVLELLQT